MSKTVKRALALMLAVLMMVSAFAACGDSGNSSSTPSESSSSSEASEPESSAASEDGESSEEEGEPAEAGAWSVPSIDSEDYDEISEYYYNLALGDFYEFYSEAMQATDVDERYVYEAMGEAKLLASGVMMPTSSNGGQYAFGRIAPGSTTTNGWGSDDERYQYAIVTNEILKTADRDALKKLLNEKRGTGEYKAAAIEYLTSNGYTLKDSYTVTFSGMPTTWDMMATSRAADTVPVLGTMDGLLYYDGENVEQPALATEWEVSDDGLTYTFKIREGVKWVDSQGREVADVVADDWVAGLQHVMDSGSGLGELFIGYVKGVENYIVNADYDMSKVGIEAPDDHTLVYHLEKATPYFTSMLHYGLSLPLSRKYYESQGGKFGADYDTEAADYQYGIDPDHIAYCGPFLITNATENNSITCEANPTYWNAENVTIKKLNRVYNDGSDVTKGYNDLKSGVIDQCVLSAATLELAKQEKLTEADEGTVFDTYAYVTATGAASYFSFLNINRALWHNFNNESAVQSTQTEEDKERTHAAVNNVHFRRAVAMAADRIQMNAQAVGDELAALSVRNTYTPATFVSLSKDVTVDINGTSTTFPAGTDYGEIMQAQMDADGVKIQVYKKDENAENGKGTGDGFDGWYSVENANEELDIAIAELEAAGITVDESNPITLDLVYPSHRTTYTNKANAYKQSVEASLGGKVIINLLECRNDDEWYDTGYNIERGYDANYDLFDLSGWSPDFMDPCSYVDTLLPNYNGYMTKCIGIY